MKEDMTKIKQNPWITNQTARPTASTPLSPARPVGSHPLSQRLPCGLTNLLKLLHSGVRVYFLMTCVICFCEFGGNRSISVLPRHLDKHLVKKHFLS